MVSSVLIGLTPTHSTTVVHPIPGAEVPLLPFLRASPEVSVGSIRKVLRPRNADVEGLAVAAAIVMRNVARIGGTYGEGGAHTAALPRRAAWVEHANRPGTDHH